MPSAKAKNGNIVKLTVILRSGVELELAGTSADAVQFHHRFKKWVDGQVHKTDNHRLIAFDGHYIHAESIAAYSAVDFDGKKIDLGPLN